MSGKACARSGEAIWAKASKHSRWQGGLRGLPASSHSIFTSPLAESVYSQAALGAGVEKRRRISCILLTIDCGYAGIEAEHASLTECITRK